MKKPIRKSLLEQILHGNIRVIGFFVLLAWLFVMITMTNNFYHSQLTQLYDDLYLYTDTVKESLQQAVVHSEHIVQSSFINSALKRTDYSTAEMLEMLDYSDEIMVASSGIQNSPKIFTPNVSLYESRWYSHISNLPEYDEVSLEFETEKTDIVFAKKLEPMNMDMTRITMYRRMPRNPGNVLRYQIMLQNSTIWDIPAEIVFSSDQRVGDTGTYLSATVNDKLSCMIKIPKGELLQGCVWIFAGGIAILLALFVLIILISRNTTRSAMREINQFMEQLDGEDLLYDSEFFRTEYDAHELNTIKQILNKLAMELKEYHDAVKNAELENKHLEMERLSMQLDPHMLYNSLAAIRLDAYRIKNEKILNLVDNMALYYREILKKDRKFITVLDEMETIRKYLFINELSHEKKYPLTTEIEPHLLNYPIPPQMFHTFVENSVVHGLSGAKQDCEIKITMKEEDGFIVTEIYDNGYGITPEKLLALNEGAQDKKHIGISNSEKRMKLVFGEESSIRFESEKNKFTRVIIRFPISRQTKE